MHIAVGAVPIQGHTPVGRGRGNTHVASGTVDRIHCQGVSGQVRIRVIGKHTAGRHVQRASLGHRARVSIGHRHIVVHGGDRYGYRRLARIAYGILDFINEAVREVLTVVMGVAESSVCIQCKDRSMVRRRDGRGVHTQRITGKVRIRVIMKKACLGPVHRGYRAALVYRVSDIISRHRYIVVQVIKVDGDRGRVTQRSSVGHLNSQGEAGVGLVIHCRGIVDRDLTGRSVDGKGIARVATCYRTTERVVGGRCVGICGHHCMNARPVGAVLIKRYCGIIGRGRLVQVVQVDGDRCRITQCPSVSHFHGQGEAGVGLVIYCRGIVDRDLTARRVDGKGIARVATCYCITKRVVGGRCIWVRGRHGVNTRPVGAVLIKSYRGITGRGSLVQVVQVDGDRGRITQRSSVGHLYGQGEAGVDLVIHRGRLVDCDLPAQSVDGKGIARVARFNGITEGVVGGRCIWIRGHHGVNTRPVGAVLVKRHRGIIGRGGLVHIASTYAEDLLIEEAAIVGGPNPDGEAVLGLIIKDCGRLQFGTRNLK